MNLVKKTKTPSHVMASLISWGREVAIKVIPHHVHPARAASLITPMDPAVPERRPALADHFHREERTIKILCISVQNLKSPLFFSSEAKV